MGFRPGPRFKEILDRVEEEELEGRLTTHSEALEFIKHNFSST